jgi:biopolymer transport protein ExbD
MVKLKSRKVLIRIAVIVLIFLIVCTFLSQTVYTANLPRVTVAYPATQAEVPISASATGEVVYDVTVVQFDVPLKV